MKFKTLSIALGLSSLLSGSLFASQDLLLFKNQRGSLLEIRVLDDNRIEGDFTTAVASKTCPQAIGIKRPITGYMIGNALSFSVVYPMCNSVLSITGNLDQDKTTLDTLSILNKQAEDIIHEGPGARFIGHDLYKKVD
ncbi:avidin/streptavidin family protein [Legionella sp. km772]|uniref:avidin/streptavidin family protein n=1 Tax=Legionella sp. km772 TaxID=2498111 RepID=UPI000F8DFF37|nr:avidin/streptavidin family protein [Legionella sp. km772]RUR07319.1 hypothetical protein ELY15_12295 [Legionella sp. km772]